MHTLDKTEETERIPVFHADHYAEVEQRVLCQLIEAALYEGIAQYSFEPRSEDERSGTYAIAGIDSRGLPVEYACRGRRMLSFGRLRVERGLVVRRGGEGETPAALAGFAEEVLGRVRNTEQLVPFMAELERTLANDAQAQAYRAGLNAPGEDADYDELEAWLDGHPYHPCYKSRIGFGLRENAAFGPEFSAELRPVWVAASRARSLLALSAEADYDSFLRRELGEETVRSFAAKLESQGLSLGDYLLLPVHPWQWEHVVLPGFHRQLADRELVLLGSGPDSYRAQQSVRSLANRSSKDKAYLKLALGIVNTSTRRTLAKHTVLNAPLVSDWLTALTRSDEVARELDFALLSEFAGISYDYETLPLTMQASAYGSLGAIWRQSVHPHLRPRERAVPLSALCLTAGDSSFIEPWLRRYGLEAWTRRVLEVTATPLIHMLYAHGIAMESHAQNLILIHRDGLPVRLALKDFHDGLRFSKSHLTHPELCPELNPEPARHRALNRHSYMQTDDLESVKDFLHSAFFFVFAADLCLFLNERHGLKEETFWELAADVIYDYQDRYPQHAANYARYDLFSETIRIEQLARRRLWKDAEVDPKAVPNPLRLYRREGGGQG